MILDYDIHENERNTNLPLELSDRPLPSRSLNRLDRAVHFSVVSRGSSAGMQLSSVVYHYLMFLSHLAHTTNLQICIFVSLFLSLTPSVTLFYHPFLLPTPSPSLSPSPQDSEALLSLCRPEGGPISLSLGLKTKRCPPSPNLLVHFHGGGFVAQTSKSHEVRRHPLYQTWLSS